MVKDYEGVFIFATALKEEELEKHLQQICNSIASRKGEIVKQERLGKRKLAYPILKNEEGSYYILNFKAPSEILSAIKDEYRLIPEIIRFMIIKRRIDLGISQ